VLKYENSYLKYTSYKNNFIIFFSFSKIPSTKAGDTCPMAALELFFDSFDKMGNDTDF